MRLIQAIECARIHRLRASAVALICLGTAIAVQSSPAFATATCDSGTACGTRDLLPPGPKNPFLNEASRSASRVLPGRTLTPAEYSAYSGIGAVVCISDGRIRSATAFLVGRFDTAVTVGHVFLSGRDWLAADQCAYTNPGPRGQIRERIPVVSIKAQWELEPETLGQPQDDLAVVRLAAPVKWAQRTMPFTRFAHAHAPVVLVGFRADLAADTLKRKSLGRVYPRSDNSCLRFTHDVDARRFSSGAPLIDIRDGVVLGLHARLLRSTSSGCASQGNAMILMNDWLETTLRAEISSATIKGSGRRRTLPTPTAR